ncbi:MAG: TlpA family protein disulfide reductase [Nitritalea sp.]
MSRKIFLLVVGGLLLCLLAGLVWKLNQKSKQEAQVSQQIQSIPSMTLATLKEEKVEIETFASNRPFLLVYFNSTCDICKITLNALNSRIEEFEDVAILLTTNQLRDEIESVSGDYPFLNQRNVQLVIDEEMYLSTYLGVRSAPSIFLYDSSGNLIANYQGPVKLDILLDKLLKREEAKP